LTGEADVPGVELRTGGAGLAARGVAGDGRALAGGLRVLEVLLEGPGDLVGDVLLDRLVAVGAGGLHLRAVAVDDRGDGLRGAVGAPGRPGRVRARHVEGGDAHLAEDHHGGGQLGPVDLGDVVVPGRRVIGI